MRKIGLYLGVEPTSGGAFQYHQSVLEAVAAIQGSKYSVVVVYSTEVWEAYIKSYNLRSKFTRTGLCEIFFDRFWKNVQLPVSLWRRICPKISPLAKVIIRENCDLWIYPSQDSLTYQIPVPSLGMIYDLMHRYERRFPEVSAYGRYLRREQHYKSMCNWTRAILVDSNLGKQHVLDSYGLCAEKIHILPSVAPKYMYNRHVPKLFDKRYKLPPRYIFYPAQFWEHKNHKRLIRAVARLKPILGDLKLVLVGSKKNGYKSALDLVRRLNLQNDVFFLGFVPDSDIPELYRRSRALVMPTFFGPTNIPPLEAFVAGCPVAISDIYGTREQVGDAAILFNPESEDAIADSIFKLWTDDEMCAKLVEKGKIRPVQWNQRHFNRRLGEILQNIL